MNTNFVLLDTGSLEEWDIFVKTCPSSTVFHHSYILQPLAKIFNCTFRIAVKKDANNSIIAGFPYLEKKKFGIFDIIYFPPMIPFYGIIHQEKNAKYLNKKTRHTHKIYKELISFLQMHYDYVKITLPYFYKDIRPFQWQNFNTAVHYTYYSDVHSIEESYNNFDPDIKRRIKNAEKTNYHLDTGVENQHISAVFELQEKSFERQGIHFQLTKNQFIDYITQLNNKSLIKIYTIKLGDKPISSILMLIFRDTAYYWMTGVDYNYLSEGYNQLNFWLMFQDLQQHGIKKFDFVGASTPTIAEYKGTFNFELQPYFMVERAFNTPTKLLFNLKKFMQ